MEFTEIVKFFSTYSKHILKAALVAGLAGTILFFAVPVKHIATGSFYIHRNVEGTTGRYFTYEGYYGQQTAQAYTNTVIALLESTDIKKKALENTGLPVNERSLRRVSKQIDVTKEAPQLITLKVKGNSETNAAALFTSISNNMVDTATALNSGGDPALLISPVGDPVVNTAYRSLPVNFLLGVSLGFISATLWYAFKRYLKGQV
jgi:capsular polysaccharide biosynthesis protein